MPIWPDPGASRARLDRGAPPHRDAQQADRRPAAPARALASATRRPRAAIRRIRAPLMQRADIAPVSPAKASAPPLTPPRGPAPMRSEEHTSELQSLMRISYAVFCLKKKTTHKTSNTKSQHDTT